MNTVQNRNLVPKKKATENSRFVLEQLSKLEQKPESFYSFIQILKSYCKFLEKFYPNHQNWNDEIFELWVVLEETYAIAASRGQTSLSPEKMKLVEDTCVKICIMVEKHIVAF